MSTPIELVRRSSVALRPDARRVIARPFLPGHELPSQGISRADAVVARVLALTETRSRTPSRALATFSDRHLDLSAPFHEHYQLVAHRIPASGAISSPSGDLIGAYLTHEYSIEAAALFNPSIAAAPGPERPRARRAAIRHDRPGRRRGTRFQLGVPHRHLRPGDDVVPLDEARTKLTTGGATQPP